MKTAKVFRQGNSHAVRLPKEFRFQEDEVYIGKNGDNVLLIPKKTERWKYDAGKMPALPVEAATLTTTFECTRDWGIPACRRSGTTAFPRWSVGTIAQTRKHHRKLSLEGCT